MVQPLVAGPQRLPLLAALACLAALFLLRSVQARLAARAARPPPARRAVTVTVADPPPPAARRQRRPAIRVDWAFLRRLVVLLRLCVPSVFGVETLLFGLLTALLVARTRLAVLAAGAIGRNAERLVKRDARGFAIGVLDIGLWAFPSSVVNSGAVYVTHLLQGRFRRNLQQAVHLAYLYQGACYHVANGARRGRGKNGAGPAAAGPAAVSPDPASVSSCIEGAEGPGIPEPAIDHPDQRLTADLSCFCRDVVDLYPQVFKPVIDVVTFMWQLSSTSGFGPPLAMIGYYVGAGALLKAALPNFARLTAQAAVREGDLRGVHTQLVQHAEEVAFYRGERSEQRTANRAMDAVVRHVSRVKALRAQADFLDSVLIKYGATIVGYTVCSIGVFAMKGATAAERTRVYMQSSQLYIPLAQAIGKLVLLHHKIHALAGHTSRVAELHEALEAVNAAASELRRSNNAVREVPRADVVTLHRVDVAPPGGGPLVRGLSLTVRRGEGWLVTGPNGCGKSALLRTILGLWRPAAGTVTRPPAHELVFLPQRPYLPHGTLREQMTFPHSAADVRRLGVSDDELAQLVDTVGLGAVVRREGGLSAVKDWHKVLSGGEKQRVAFIRMLYHRPVFGFIDEATSAVSQEIEPAMYEAAIARGVTLVTVSHREGLRRFHRRVLALDGCGGHEVTAVEEC